MGEKEFPKKRSGAVKVQVKDTGQPKSAAGILDESHFELLF